MKTGIRPYSLLVLGLILCFTGRCKKEDPVALAELTTSTLTGITSTSVISGGSISSDGGSFVITRGVCWGENPNPTIFDKFTTEGEGAGKFVSTITGLISGTVYFIRAYATNNKGTAYGNEFIFIAPLADIDGNIYNTLTIGEQVWMTQNLRNHKIF